MQEIEKQLSGVFAPITTPFKDDKVDESSLIDNIERLNATGLRGYFVLGTNGEYRSLSIEERWNVLRIVVRYRCRDKVIMAGCGAESTHETIDLVLKAVALGADMISLLMPSFFAKRMSTDVMERYAREVADISPAPILLYNNPSVAAGVTIRSDLLRRLADHDYIVGIKDSSKETWKENLTIASPRFFVLAGSAGYFLELLRVGGIGGVLSLANVFPEECVRLYCAHMEGNSEEANNLNAKLVELNSRVSGSFGVAGVKAAMDLVGYKGGLPRRPHFGLTIEEIEQLRDALYASGFLREPIT
jgi:4-hydroxy-2-oxoglutarate aldolase